MSKSMSTDRSPVTLETLAAYTPPKDLRPSEAIRGRLTITPVFYQWCVWLFHCWIYDQCQDGCNSVEGCACRPRCNRAHENALEQANELGAERVAELVRRLGGLSVGRLYRLAVQRKHDDANVATVLRDVDRRLGLDADRWSGPMTAVKERGSDG